MIEKRLKEELTAKTLTYSLIGTSSLKSKDIEKFLLEKLKKNSIVRVCIHSNSEELTQYMIIAIRKDNLMKFHKNLNKDKIYYLKKGKMKIVLSENSFEIEEGDIFKLNKNEFAKMISISDESIYHEIIAGPFCQKDTIYE
jgi:mannose-6-phosphate isomerase-like protein (cupin superfamily)